MQFNLIQTSFSVVQCKITERKFTAENVNRNGLPFALKDLFKSSIA